MLSAHYMVSAGYPAYKEVHHQEA